MDEDFEWPETPQGEALREIRAHHGKIEGLPNRSGDAERLKLWYLPSFMDAASFSVISTLDEQGTYLRKSIWHLSGRKPGMPRRTCLEKKISIDSFNKLQGQLAGIRMNPFKVSSDQWMDAGIQGMVLSHGDTHIDLTWSGVGEEDWKELEKWVAKTWKYFEMFFPKAG
jgi:hypothetical protein